MATSSRDDYTCFVRQEPAAARACGNAEKPDRRPIDPVVVIQLKCNGVPEIQPDVYNARLICYATLLDATLDRPIVPDQQGRQKMLPTLCGTILASISHLRDPEKESCRGAFFVFSDLNVRSEGSYRLRFDIYQVGHKVSEHVSQCTTKIFTVYSAKRFPGMSQSTELSQMFADQGLKIRIRRDMRLRKKQKLQQTQQQQQQQQQQNAGMSVPLLPYSKAAISSQSKFDSALFDQASLQPDRHPSFSHSNSFSSSGGGSIAASPPGYQDNQSFAASKRYVPAYSTSAPGPGWQVPIADSKRQLGFGQPAPDYLYGRSSSTAYQQYPGSNMPYNSDGTIPSNVYQVWPDYGASDATPSRSQGFAVPQVGAAPSRQPQQLNGQFDVSSAAVQNSQGYLPMQAQHYQQQQSQPQPQPQQQQPQQHHQQPQHQQYAQPNQQMMAADAAAADLIGFSYGRPALPPLQSILSQGKTREARVAQ